jgi:hypothetical protein
MPVSLRVDELSFSPERGNKQMARGKKQDIYTGNGDGQAPILADGQSTAAQSKPSQASTKNGAGSTKPVSVTEGLSLLQTLSLDLRSLDCHTAILAQGRRAYVIIEIPASIGNLTMKNGHIYLGELPVSDL